MSEKLRPFYDKTVKCPVCSFTYTTTKVRSRFIRVEKIEADFFTKYKDEELNPVFYEVNVCKKCGYAFADTFSNSFSPTIIDSIKSQITNKWKERDFGSERTIQQVIDTYKLAILSGSIKQEKSVVLAGISLRLAWLYRIIKIKEQEHRFLKLSLENYKDSYANSDYSGTQMTEMRLFYLIGELSRQIGDRDGAVKFFSKVINHKNRSMESKLVEMAREQWYLIRENDKVI